MRVVLPHPPPPIIRIRGTVYTMRQLAHGVNRRAWVCAPFRCTRQACSTGHIRNAMQSICSSLKSIGCCGSSLTPWMSFQATRLGPRSMPFRGILTHCPLSLVSSRARSCNESFKSRSASSSAALGCCARISLVCARWEQAASCSSNEGSGGASCSGTWCNVFLQHALTCWHTPFHLGIRCFGAARGIGTLNFFVSVEHCLTFFQVARFNACRLMARSPSVSSCSSQSLSPTPPRNSE